MRIINGFEQLGIFLVRGGKRIIQTLRHWLVFTSSLCSRLIVRTTRVRYTFLGILAAVLILTGIGFASYKIWVSDLPLIYRDVNVALYAHRMKGAEIPLRDIDYTVSYVYPPSFQFGETTNSVWLWERARNVVPFFEYEGLTSRGIYPLLTVFSPRVGESSLKVGGWAWPPAQEVYLNERAITVPEAPANEGDIIGTLVHELIHIQGGNFFLSPEDVGVIGSAAWSQWIESHTAAATIEILAGMCLYDDKAACYAFWDQVESSARSSLKYRLLSYGRGGLYEWFANTFLRDRTERIIAEKSVRYWQSNVSELTDILNKYGRYPWEEYVIPAVRDGERLDTGIVDCPMGWHPGMYCQILGLKFDDTAVLMKRIQGFLWLGVVP